MVVVYVGNEKFKNIQVEFNSSKTSLKTVLEEVSKANIIDSSRGFSWDSHELCTMDQF